MIRPQILHLPARVLHGLVGMRDLVHPLIQVLHHRLPENGAEYLEQDENITPLISRIHGSIFRLSRRVLRMSNASES